MIVVARGEATLEAHLVAIDAEAFGEIGVIEYPGDCKLD